MDKDKKKINEAFEVFKKTADVQDVFIVAISKENPKDKNMHTVLCAFEANGLRIMQALLKSMEQQSDLKDFIMHTAALCALDDLEARAKIAKAKADKKTHTA